MIINIAMYIERIGIPDQFIEHGDVDQLLRGNSYYERRSNVNVFSNY